MNKFGTPGKERNHKITAVLLALALLLLSVSAIWADSEESFTIRYNGNGADSGSISDERVKGPEVTLKKNESVSGSSDVPYQKAGCTFVGWSMKESTAEGLVEIIPGGEVWTVDDEAIIHYYNEKLKGYTLYAWWKCPEGIVGSSGSSERYLIYDGNGADRGNIVRQAAARNSSVTVKDNADSEDGDLLMTRTDYVFAGWNTKADGSGISYKAGDTVELEQNITLYAQWKQEQASFGQIMQNALSMDDPSAAAPDDADLFANPAPAVVQEQPVPAEQPAADVQPLPASNVQPVEVPANEPAPAASADEEEMINPAIPVDVTALAKNINFYHPETGQGFTWLIDYDFGQQ